jgi:hypothetical protein
MKAVVVHRAQTRDEHAAVSEALGECGIAQQRGEVETGAFDEKIATGGDVWQHEMTTVSGKGDLVFTSGDGARLGLEFAVKELVEGAEGIRRIGEFAGVHAIRRQEWGDLGPTRWSIHAAAVPA